MKILNRESSLAISSFVKLDLADVLSQYVFNDESCALQFPENVRLNVLVSVFPENSDSFEEYSLRPQGRP